MIRMAGIQFRDLPDEKFDAPLGLGTGAAVIFGATGGVMEAALRTAYEKITGEELPALDFKEVRGTDGIKEATYDLKGTKMKVAVASSTKCAHDLMKKVQSGEADYTFIEVMGCPGGCVNGGGQPQQPGYIRNTVDLAKERAKALYENDRNCTYRKSHENPAIIQLYDEFLGQPGSHLAHELLHTTYIPRTVHEIK